MGLGEDGRLGFRGIDLTAHLETDPGSEPKAAEAAERAEESCFVSLALSIPVRPETLVRTAAPAA